LIPRFGMMGASIAVLSSVVLSGLLVLVEIRILHGIYPFALPTLKPFVAGAVALGVQLALGAHIDRVALRVPLVIVAGLVCYLGALALLGLPPEDRRLAAGLWARLRPGQRQR